MLENREYFVLDSEHATRIDEYHYAITESGRLWEFWNSEPGKEQEDKVTPRITRSGKNYILKPGFVTPLIPIYGYINVELHGGFKLRSNIKPWHKGGQKHVQIIKKIPLHILVAQYFISNPDGYEFVEHIDRIKTNNHYSNLRWVAEDPINLGYYNDRNKGAFFGDLIDL